MNSFQTHYDRKKQAEIDEERAAVIRLEECIAIIKADAQWYWRWGDGQGGYFLDKLEKAIKEAGETWPFDQRSPNPKAKKKIAQHLRVLVFERDAYRCVTCNGHNDLACDHIIPESKGGPTTFDNLQTMCRSCNSRKGNRA